MWRNGYYQSKRRYPELLVKSKIDTLRQVFIMCQIHSSNANDARLFVVKTTNLSLFYIYCKYCTAYFSIIAPNIRILHPRKHEISNVDQTAVSHVNQPQGAALRKPTNNQAGLQSYQSNLTNSSSANLIRRSEGKVIS